MLGKLELVYDRNLQDDFDFRITSEGYNKVLNVEGDKFAFHVERPFVGEASVRFKETDATPAGNWALDVGGVMFGPVAGRDPAKFHVRFGGTYSIDTGITRADKALAWHTVKWKVSHDSSPLHMKMHRYIEVYFDNVLVARHGYPSGIHSMKFVHWQGDDDAITHRVLLDDISFVETLGETNRVAPLSPNVDGSLDPLGVSTDDFDVMSEASAAVRQCLEAGYAAYVQMDVPPGAAARVLGDPEDHYVHLWVNEAGQDTLSGTARTVAIPLDTVPFYEVPFGGGWYRAVFGANGALGVSKPPLCNDYEVSPGLYWITAAIVQGDDPFSRMDARTTPLLTHGGFPTRLLAFDERLLLVQGQTVTGFAEGEAKRVLVAAQAHEKWGTWTGDHTTRVDLADNNIGQTVLYPRPESTYYAPGLYRGVGSSTMMNFAYRLPVSDTDRGKLHKVVIEYPVDEPRDMVFSVTEILKWGPDFVHSPREPMSACVFLAGNTITSEQELGSVGGQPRSIMPTAGPPSYAERTFYIYPGGYPDSQGGGQLLVSAMTRTGGMPAAIRAIRVYVLEQELPPGAPFSVGIPTDALDPLQVGMYFESPGAMRNVFGTWVSGIPEKEYQNDWTRAPTCWNLPARYHALKNYIAYTRYVNWHFRDQLGQVPDYLDTLSFDVVYYGEAMFPTDVFDTMNFEMVPGQKVARPNVVPAPPVKYIGEFIETNSWPNDNAPGYFADYYTTMPPSPIADFDFAGFTAAVCQGKGLKFLPVIDFRGTPELDYLCFPRKFTGHPGDSSVNGWKPEHVEQNADHPNLLRMVSNIGMVATGFYMTTETTADMSHGGALNGGYNPLHPTVRSRIVQLAEDLHERLRPFMAGTNYLGGLFDNVGVGSVAILMDERSCTNQMITQFNGAIWDAGHLQSQFPIGDNYWRQSQFSFDDATWEQFVNYCQPPKPPDEPDPQQYPGNNRFARRYRYLNDADDWQRWRDFRASAIASLYKDFLDEVSGSGNTAPKLALLYLAPTAPNINLNYAEFAHWENPTAIPNYLRDAAVLPADIHAWLHEEGGEDLTERIIYVPPTFSMIQTMYGWPPGKGEVSTYNRLPRGWSTGFNPDGNPQTGPDTLWIRQRWYDYDSSANEATGWVKYRDYTLDSYFPAYSPGVSPLFGTGAWVYHDFVEPSVEYDRNNPNNMHGWGLNDSSTYRDYPVFGAVSEPADVFVSWSQYRKPVFAQDPGPASTKAWGVPYYSFYDYFINRMQQKNISLMLMGGWDTTAIFGHEKDLKDALYYGKFIEEPPGP
jgi:hypothetical protein